MFDWISESTFVWIGLQRAMIEALYLEKLYANPADGHSLVLGIVGRPDTFNVAQPSASNVSLVKSLIKLCCDITET